MSDTEFPLEDTLCKDCKYRFSRWMIPFDYSEFDIDLDELGLDDDDILQVEQHVCLKIDQDISGLVTQCTHYEQDNAIDIFIKNVTK